MLFRLLWQDKAERMTALPDILIGAGDGVAEGAPVLHEPFWLFSPAVPFLFLEELAERIRIKSASSPREVLVCLKKAARDLDMTLPEMGYRLVKPADRHTGGGLGERIGHVERSGDARTGYVESPDRAESTDREERDSAAQAALSADLARRVRGRQIADAEVLRLSRESGYREIEIWRFLQREVTLGRAVWRSAVAREGWGMGCRRCGCQWAEEWPAYYGKAFSCKECVALGGVSSLDVLWQEREAEAGQENGNAGFWPVREAVLTMPFALSRAQQKASAELEGAEQDRVLVWAACGAGKTEVCFSRMAQMLESGKRVLFAAPRRDVIHDVVPRLAQAFPRVEMTVLSGASPERFGSGQLVAATTHQVMRFYRAFDLIVLDELDAFPFTDGDFLRRAVDQALRPDGKMVFLTATPEAKILRQVKKGRCGLIQLPARHHRKPLPVPVWQKCALPPWEGLDGPDSGGVSALARGRSVLEEVLERLSGKGTTLVFVPCVAHVALWLTWLKPWFPRKRINGSWSSDPDRAQKIEALKRGGYAVFVTTSILERGITLDGAQVAVVWADHPLFDERMLVQMAGRTGRKRERPDGEAVFLAARCSGAMTRAERWILEQNALARRQGLLDTASDAP